MLFKKEEFYFDPYGEPLVTDLKLSKKETKWFYIKGGEEEHDQALVEVKNLGDKDKEEIQEIEITNFEKYKDSFDLLNK